MGSNGIVKTMYLVLSANEAQIQQRQEWMEYTSKNSHFDVIHFIASGHNFSCAFVLIHNPI